MGAINGAVAYLKTRPFLTTLVTLIILRAASTCRTSAPPPFSPTSSMESNAWDFLGGGTILGVPSTRGAMIVLLSRPFFSDAPATAGT